jgi:hypothetical protein
MPSTTPATDLAALSLDELWVELIWLSEQPETKAMCDAFRKCRRAIAARQAVIDDWNDFLAG